MSSIGLATGESAVPLTLAAVNAATPEDFVAMLGGAFEHSPWVAARACSARPFASVVQLHAAMMETVRSASAAERLALIRAHPELAGREAAVGALTADSSSEQGRLGFTSLSRAEFERVARANEAYRARFGFPCIVALALHATRATVIAEMERRARSESAADAAAEIDCAIGQIGAITRHRLARLITD
jgi:2-oxo-4-hydroxy-4-carboxy-5-ureidoimidazoline decarboxylase